MKPGPEPAGERALTPAERQARYRAAQAAGVKPARYHRPADRRSRPRQWEDAITALYACLDAYQAWRDGLPDNLAEAAIGARLDALLALREHVKALEAAICPRGSAAID